MLPADSPFASLPAPGPHPATDELRAYAAGTLNPADEHRIEAHALDCERCAELLEGFSMSDAATTDQALAGLRTRLQARVADDLTGPALLPASRPLWPRLAAGVALLGAIGAGIWGWEHQAPAAEVATAPYKTAAPAATPQPTGSAPAAELPRPAAALPAAPSRPADYAAVRPKRRTQSSRPFPRPAPPAAVLADQNADASAPNDGWGTNAAANADVDAKKITGRAATISVPTEPAVVAAEAEAAPRAVAAAPSAAAPAKPLAKAPAKVLAAADTNALGASGTIAGRFEKAKASESVAIVRDKPLTMNIAIAPAPVAGTPALRSYLHHEAAKFELEDGAKPLSGTVRLRFIVEADGKLSNLQVVRGMRADYDEEALRMVCEGPAWRPGIAGGRRTALPVEVTVSF